MNKCQVCGSSKIHNELIDEILYISGKPVLVEHILPKVCNQCGEQTFSRQTTEQIRLMLHGQAIASLTEAKGLPSHGDSVRLMIQDL